MSRSTLIRYAQPARGQSGWAAEARAGSNRPALRRGTGVMQEYVSGPTEGLRGLQVSSLNPQGLVEREASDCLNIALTRRPEHHGAGHVIHTKDLSCQWRLKARKSSECCSRRDTGSRTRKSAAPVVPQPEPEMPALATPEHDRLGCAGSSSAFTGAQSRWHCQPLPAAGSCAG